MNGQVFISPGARRDLAELGFYLASQSRATAERFLRAVGRAFHRLAEMPELGGRCEFRDPALADLRVWPVPRFPRYLIYYRPFGDGIEVVRVLHGARDIESVFGEQEP